MLLLYHKRKGLTALFVLNKYSENICCIITADKMIYRYFSILYRKFTSRFQDIYRNLSIAVPAPRIFPSIVLESPPYIS